MSYCTRTNYLLCRWKAMLQNRGKLSLKEKENAKILFAGLKELTPSEVKFLAEKYYYTNDGANYDERLKNCANYIPVSDEVLARSHKQSINQYGRKRRKVEKKLQERLVYLSDKFEKEDAESRKAFKKKVFC